MSKDNYTFDDLDDILAEFSSSRKVAAEPAQSAAPTEDSFAPAIKPLDAERGAAAPAARAAARAEAEATEAPRPAHKAKSASRAPGSSFEEFEALFSSKAIKKQAAEKSAVLSRPAQKSSAPSQSGSQRKEPVYTQTRLDMPGAKPAPAASKASVRPAAPAEPRATKGSPDRTEARQKPLKPAAPAYEQAEEKKGFSPLHMLLSLVFACLSLLMLVWVLFNVHPASGTVSSGEGNTVLKLSDKLDVYMNNMASDALGELAYIRKIYTLQESDTVAPVPNPDGFGRTTDVAVIQDIIKQAAPLLDGQTVSFDPNADFVPDTEFLYYLDDTILVIAWKEYISERCCTIAEVKIAHGSQIRRKLAEDSYSSSVQYYASDMANASNAVVAINGDFYAFRDLGITVYQRNLYRNNPATVDSCFFTADGDMLFSRAGELMGEGETQQFIEDNDVVFAVAFGPVLVDNGELQYCESYPIGEINTEYSRSCIGMTDDLHYLLMTINHTPDARPRATINEMARYIYGKGVEKAYALDGGQTAEIVMMGGPINHVDFGYERAVSDIIYFATAIPNEEVSQ